MENKKEYLNEEWYQKIKKKVKKTSLIILILSLLVGGGLIAAGFIATDNSKKEAEKELEETLKQAEEQVAAIDTKIATLNAQLDTLSAECDSYTNVDIKSTEQIISMSKCTNEKYELEAQISELEMDRFMLEDKHYIVNADDYRILSFIGGGVILFGSLTALIVYFVAIRREVAAFSAQQIMPIAQEGIDKLAPTVGNAAGTIAKGIQDGLKSSQDDTPKR